MKKLSLLIGTLAISAWATTPIHGPYLSKIVGNPKAGNWVACTILPGQVTVTDFINGKAKPQRTDKAKVEAADLKAKITAASKEKLDRVLHVAETIPNVNISAGIYPDLLNFKLLARARSTEIRRGNEAAELMTLVNNLCGALKPANSPRESE